VFLTGTRTGRTATCVCGRPLTEWAFGTPTTSWCHDEATRNTILCPGWREAEPVEGTIREKP
jgi:hypothetical protein